MNTRMDNFAGEGNLNPDYTVFDLILGYNKKFENVTWNSQINVKNLFDKEYFNGRYLSRWGRERQVVWQNTFKF